MAAQYCITMIPKLSEPHLTCAQHMCFCLLIDADLRLCVGRRGRMEDTLQQPIMARFPIPTYARRNCNVAPISLAEG
jgi:hypothetical protein